MMTISFRPQGRNQKLRDILDESRTVHGAVDDRRRGDPVVPQRRNEVVASWPLLPSARAREAA